MRRRERKGAKEQETEDTSNKRRIEKLGSKLTWEGGWHFYFFFLVGVGWMTDVS